MNELIKQLIEMTNEIKFIFQVNVRDHLGNEIVGSGYCSGRF